MNHQVHDETPVTVLKEVAFGELHRLLARLLIATDLVVECSEELEHLIVPRSTDVESVLFG